MLQQNREQNNFNNKLDPKSKIRMKRSYQLMQIYDIQKEYSIHKSRLKSIKDIDAKKKACNSTLKNYYNLSIYKKSHSMASSFICRQQDKKIQKQNDYLYNTLMRQVVRKPRISLRNSQSSKSLMRNTSLSVRSSRIKQQNDKIKSKIQTTKSSYQKIRKSNAFSGMSRNNHNKRNQKQQLKRFIQNQFRIKPTVLFPRVKRTQPQAQKLNPQAKLFKPNMPSKQTLHTNINKHRSTRSRFLD